MNTPRRAARRPAAPQAASTVYLGLGSNVEAQRYLSEGIAALRRDFGEIRLSPAYRSAAVGFEGRDFINLAARITTHLQPLQMKEYLNALEAHFGRERNLPKFSDRTLDIDILLWDDLHARLPGLSLPRPEILHYAHVLAPLADLAPDLVHPAVRRTLARLWAEFPVTPGLISLVELRLGT